MHVILASVSMIVVCVSGISLVPEAGAQAGMLESEGGYAMYVWTLSFDSTVAGCDKSKLEQWDTVGHPECYTHSWSTAEARQWLWDTCNRDTREIRTLFVSGFKDRLQEAYDAQDCSGDGVASIRTLLRDAHCHVPGLQLYALFADSDEAVSEQRWTPYIPWYNQECAQSAEERVDGVAINNEAWNTIKCQGDAAREQLYLDRLHNITMLADGLPTHFSLGYHWGECDGAVAEVEWQGVSQPATMHMIDIFNSTDVQVGHVDFGVVVERAQRAGYEYSVAQGKSVFMTSYLNQVSLDACTTTHFPYGEPACSYGWSNSRRSEDYYMENIVDAIPGSDVPALTPCIHYFRGVYSAGAHPDWPSHYQGAVQPSPCIA